MKRLLIVLYLVTAVVVGAIADGLFDEGLKIWGHTLGAVEVCLLLSGAFVFDLRRRDWFAFAAAYVCLRIAGFDYVYNLVRGLPILEVGSTSAWDNVISLFPPHGLVFVRSIFLVVGIFIPINEL